MQHIFKKEDSKLITHQSGDNRSMIDYLMVRKTDCCLVKVISSEECVPQHRMVIGRLVIPMKPQKNKIVRLQTTQPTSGGAVTVVSSCCANCVEPPRPQQWGPDLPFFGHAGHADPLDGWRCCSQKWVMSRPIQVRQL